MPSPRRYTERISGAQDGRIDGGYRLELDKDLGPQCHTL